MLPNWNWVLRPRVQGSDDEYNREPCHPNTQSSDNAGNTAGNSLSTNDAYFSHSHGRHTQPVTRANTIDRWRCCNYSRVPVISNRFSTFSIDLYKTSDSPILNLQNTNALTSTVSTTTFNKIDFFNIVTANGTGVATVNYTGTGAAQEVYNFISGSTTVDGIIDNSGFSSGDGSAYENIGFSGSGTKTVDGGCNNSYIECCTPLLRWLHGTETVDLSASNTAT